MEVVKYLCEVGGKELLMMTSKVSGWMHVCGRVLADMDGCRDAVMQACSHVHMYTGVCRP